MKNLLLIAYETAITSVAILANVTQTAALIFTAAWIIGGMIPLYIAERR